MPRSQSPTMIEAEGLTKFFGDFAAIKDVSFKVCQGEVVAFLGPNGAGKSTTMKLLTGYLAPSAGMARIAGHDMSNDRFAGSTRLGYLPENGPLYPDMSPRSLLEFFADGPRPDAARGSRSGSMRSWSCVPWEASLASPSASSRGVTGSASAWRKCCCTNRMY